MQQHVRVRIVHRVREVLGAARRLVFVQLQQLLRAQQQADEEESTFPERALEEASVLLLFLAWGVMAMLRLVAPEP